MIEAADMLLPAGSGDVASLNDKQLHRIGIVQDWFSDPAFMNGGDSVILFAESRKPDSSARVASAAGAEYAEVLVADPRRASALHPGLLGPCAKYKPKLWSTQERSGRLYGRIVRSMHYGNCCYAHPTLANR